MTREVAPGIHRLGHEVSPNFYVVEMARTAKPQSRERGMRPYLRHGPTWRLLITGTRLGAARRPKIASVSTFAEGDELDVPGHPRVVHAPGHSNGHVVFHFPDRGALLAGDVIVTYNPLTGRLGPQIMPAAFNVSSGQAIASLERIESLEAGVLVVGHGDPWTGGVAEAVARAREAGPS